MADCEQIKRPKSDIEILSEIRSEYNCFDEKEEPRYWALSRGIDALLHEPKHGKWVWQDWGHYCSECKQRVYEDNLDSILDCTYKYCFNCGAKMDGGDE